MRVLTGRVNWSALLESVGDSLDVPRGIKKLPGGGSGKALKAGLIAAGGLAGLTAGSAGISSLGAGPQGEVRARRRGAREAPRRAGVPSTHPLGRSPTAGGGYPTGRWSRRRSWLASWGSAS